MRKLLLLSGILILVACGVRQPVDPSNNETITGNIFVQSGSISGQIFLDGKITNKSTPDTLFNIPTGPHIIKVILEGYRSAPDSIQVLVKEDSTSSVIFELEKLIFIGFVGIESTPARAEIFVDEQTTGQFTPDTVQLEAGLHQVKIIKNGYYSHEWEINVVQDSAQNLETAMEIQQRVLLESFANVSCDPCIEAAENIEEFINTSNVEQYAIIEYFANWPSPNDPFYKVSPKDVDKRLTYYSVNTLPTLKINGASTADATNYSDMESVYQNALATQNSSIGLSIEKNLVEDSLQVHIEVYNFTDILNNDQLRLFVCVTENDIHFDSPPGTNGLTDFDFVFRTFLTSNEGESINSGSKNKILDYNLSWPDWNYTNCKVVAFIQNITSKQIIQTSIN